MSGWRIVPMRMPGDSDADYVARINAAPEPDWEALAETALAAFRYDSPDETRAFGPGHDWARDLMMRALKATFGSKP